ncbi:MAG TPA: hypothetical protein DD637_06225, partial [Verrucomicrobia bacterium]|nr:hypothetical protein [Verrucomicrobiota bacterium]
MTRAAFGFLALIGLLAFLALGSLLFGGCSSIPTGVRVVASSATATSLGNINWDTYTIPVFSVYTGPKTTIWVNRDYLALSRVSAGGCVTNDTSALGVYQTREQKQTRVELEFAPQGSALAAPAASQEPAPDA